MMFFSVFFPQTLALVWPQGRFCSTFFFLLHFSVEVLLPAFSVNEHELQSCLYNKVLRRC